jgi:hypothetical protein
MKKKGLIVFSIIFVFGFFFMSCDNSTGSDEKYTEYDKKYTEHDIWYLGFKPGLYSWSSSQEFDDALNEIRQEYFADKVNNEGTHNGTSYEVKDNQWTWITGGVPKYVWDAFWKDIGEYNATIGSCWHFNYIEIPSKGANGTVYVINAIVTNTDYSIRYSASKGIMTPKRSIMLEYTPQRRITNGNCLAPYSDGSGFVKPQSGYRP